MPQEDMPTAAFMRKPRPRRKVNEEKMLELAALGVSDTDIAKHQGVNPSTAWRFLQAHRLESRQVETFKSRRADLLAGLQGKCQDLQRRILDSIQDGVIKAMKPGEKTGLLVALNATAGTSFDKERLERGQSTSNQSIISRLLDDSVKSLYRPVKQVIDSTDGHTPQAGV